MADDTTSSPDPSRSDLSRSDLSTPDPSAPGPADQAVEQGVEPVVNEVVEDQVVEQTAEPVDSDVALAVERTVEEIPQPVGEQPVAQPASAPVTAPPEPSVATTLVVAPASAPLAAQMAPSADEKGGEWELLMQKLRQWLNQGELQSLWSQARKPVTLLAALVGLLLVLRVYSAVLGALASLPLVPGLLELAGLVWSVRYGVPKLLRSSEREQLLTGLSNRWNAFRGKG